LKVYHLVIDTAVVTSSRHADRSCAHHQTKVQWSQVAFNVSKPGLSGLANPPSPVSRRAQNASLLKSYLLM